LQFVLLRPLLFVEITLLVVQFIAGSFIFLSPIPTQLNLGFFSLSGSGLGIHHYIAAFALIFSGLIIVSSFIVKNPLLSRLSILGLSLLIGAFATGIAFVYLQRIYLYPIAMGAFFISALITYVSAIILFKN
jgi:hypothetical protein